MVISPDELSPETLRAIVEEFVSREGTDYGHSTYTLESKVSAVLRQIADRRALVVFDPETESCSIVDASLVNQSSSR